MPLYVGTSGYQYKEWKGSFYPDNLPTDAMLQHYASVFRTCEINNTFYRTPKESVVVGWTERVPDGFRFVFKASRRITHINRLRAADEPLQWYLRSCSQLGLKRGASLFQLPPNFKKDVERLTAFLALLPDGWPAAFEFRHESWFADEVYDALRARNAALCIADTDEVTPPKVKTADWGYLRLRGTAYSDGELQEWATWVNAQGWKDAYVFFKHEDAGAGPALGRQFMEIAGGA
jgi:uncharacterized protein YecE (DUF72 family)